MTVMVSPSVRFTHLTVLRYLKAGRWLVRCDCGTEKETSGQRLREGKAKSCGCMKATLLSSAHSRHGESGGGWYELRTPEYSAWLAMKARCETPSHKSYPDYGGRGITVCEQWRNSYEEFLKDVGRRPSSKHSIGRIDNDKGYYLGNVRWETDVEQARNQRHNRLVTMHGVTKCVRAWAEDLRVDIKLVESRIGTGWSPERALTTPRLRKRRDSPVEFHGMLKPLRVWAEELGIAYATLRARLFISRWSPEKAFTTPVR